LPLEKLNIRPVARVLAVVVLMALPRGLVAQDADQPSMLRVDARLGLAGHDGGIGADKVNAYQAEIVLRSRGPVVLGVGAGLINSGSYAVQLVQPVTEYEGEPVTISGGSSSFSYSPRFRGLIGYSFEIAPGLFFEPTGEGGVARMRGERGEWQPWAVGSIALRGASGIGAQLGFGRHRVSLSYHSWGSGTLVNRFFEWEEFTELLFSFPLI
jgi:hypothetical protein